MRSKVVRSLALVLVLSGVGMTAEQQPGNPGSLPKQPGPGGSGSRPKPKAAPEKSKLEEMLAEAFKSNPDIRVAAANLTLAEAELNRVRLQVMQKVSTLYHAILSQQATVNFEQKRYERMQELLKRGAIDAAVADETFTKLAAAKAKLEELEAQLPALLGKSGRAEASSGFQHRIVVQETMVPMPLWRVGSESVAPSISLAEWEKRHKAAGPMAERLRKALQTPVKVDFKDMALDAILKDLAKKVEGLSFRNIVYLSNSNIEKIKINLRFEEALPVAAILQALEDETRCSFIVREYGILATTGSNLPEGALTVKEFLRQKPADEPRRQPADGKNPPALGVDGVVDSIDSSGLMKINIGSDSGLAKGQTLELFRLNPAKYLGTIRILEASAKESIAKGVGGFSDTPKVGDRVSSRILGN